MTRSTSQIPEVRVDNGPEEPSLRLSGVVGILHAQELLSAARALAERNSDVSVDGTAVEYLDGAALQVLVALRQEVERRGHVLRTSWSERAAQLLRLAGLHESLQPCGWHPTPER